jgi:PAS domain S-box-containing protein
MDTVRHKTGLSRLPSLAAIFVARVCAAIFGMSGWGECSARETRLKHAGTGGVLLGTISASYLWNFYGNFEVGRHSGITLLYADGHVIARNPDNANEVGRNLSHKPLFRNLSLQSTSRHLQFHWADETERVSCFRRSDRFPLVLLATMQYGELLASWRNAAISRMSFVLALVMLNAIIGFFLVRQAQRGQHLARVLAFEEANFRLLAEGSNDMVTRIGLDDLVSYASPSSVPIVGWRPDQLVGTSAPGGINPLDLPATREIVERLKRGEMEEARTTHRTRHREKGDIWIESTLRVTRKDNGEIDGAVAITRDVTEQKDLAERLETLATEDGLTGVANRRRFDERVQEQWSRADRERGSLGLLIVDLDHFKEYNDEYGRPAGD